ncbi:Uncharacterised protein [Escherichia coli]|nr:Uncharacterised protein [Escherichia coli]CAC9177063.1 Uncharacterised protein [Escherichia coli]
MLVNDYAVSITITKVVNYGFYRCEALCCKIKLCCIPIDTEI